MIEMFKIMDEDVLILKGFVDLMKIFEDCWFKRDCMC